MTIGTPSRCEHVYLHVDRRFHIRGEGAGLVPRWRCTLKKKDLANVCGELGKVGLIDTECHPEECPLANKHMPWEKCPLYIPICRS